MDHEASALFHTKYKSLGFGQESAGVYICEFLFWSHGMASQPTLKEKEALPQSSLANEMWTGCPNVCSGKRWQLEAICASSYINFQWICDYHFVFADRRATARTTTFVEPCCENLTTRHYKYLHKVRSALLASASNKNPKQTETSTNVTATLFTTTKEDTCAM